MRPNDAVEERTVFEVEKDIQFVTRETVVEVLFLGILQRMPARQELEFPEDVLFR